MMYNDKIIEAKKNYIKSKKIALAFDLIWMRIAQVVTFIAVPAVMFIVWDKCFTCDVLYLCGWWIILCPIALLFASLFDKPIDCFRKHELAKIRKSAAALYDRELMMDVEDFN